MKKQWIPVALVAVIALAALGVANSACRRAGKDVAGNVPPAAVSHNTSGVQWISNWDDALTRAKKENKAVVVDFYADWCVWCRRLDSTTYRDPKVVRYLTENTVPLKLNVEDNPGRAMANKYGVDGLPTIVILSPEGRELGRIPGYMPADGFLEAVRRYVPRS